MAGAAEQLAERRERKRTAAERYAEAQRLYIWRVFNEIHLPNLTRVVEGTCTAIDTNTKIIEVRFDATADGLVLPELDVNWDRPKLTESEVVNKRVKVFITYDGITRLTLAAITSE